jgi:voltage-gated potassium channel Kch
LFKIVGLDYGDHPTRLSPLYYSVVTLTTLGYGDIVPSSLTGQLIAMIEVITGYVMLGGLLSIFSNKMARRGD